MVRAVARRGRLSDLPFGSILRGAYTPFMRSKPAWMIDNDESVRRESARYRHLDPRERLRLTAMACRAAARQWRARPDYARLLAYRDPLPDSTLAHLERLRALHRRNTAPS